MKKFNLLVISLCFTALNYAQPSFQWAKTFGDAQDGEQGNAIVTDAANNIYIAGVFEGIVDFDPGPGTYTLNSNSINNTDIFVTKLDVSGNLLWVRSIGAPGSDDAALGMTLDVSGNIYVTGNFSGTVDFDPGSATYALTAGAGDIDVFVLKLNPAGNFVWAKNMGGTSFVYANAIAVDTSSNVYTTGYFEATADFDPGPATYTISSAGLKDVFVSKLDANGNFVWAKTFGGTNSEEGYGITVDGSDNVYISGNFKGTCDFDPSAGTYSIVSGGTDIFVSKLDAVGNFIWAKAMKGGTTATNSSGRCIKTDVAGNVYAAGFYNGVIDFDPGPATYTLSSSSSTYGFVSKLSSSGNLTWIGDIRGASHTTLKSIDVDVVGNVYGTGFFVGNTDFDPAATSFSLSPTSGSRDAYLFKWNTSGAFVWARDIIKHSATGGLSEPLAIAINPSSGAIHTTGRFDGTADFDPGAATVSLSTVGTWDIFISKIGQDDFCVVPATPINTTPAAGHTICAGSAATITATSTGTVNWYATSTGTNALGTGTTYVTSSLAAGQYTYYAEATTCTVSASRTAITITVNPAPVISVNSGSICSGNSFTIEPTGAATYTITGGSAVVSPLSTTSYSVTGTSSEGCISSNAAVSIVTVGDRPWITVNSGSICSGSSFTIEPAGAISYTISGGSVVVSPASTTSYTVIGMSAEGCMSENLAVSEVTVYALPIISVNSGSICSGSSFTIEPTGAISYTISGGSVVVSPLSTASYSVAGTSSEGCISSNAAVSEVTVYALPSLLVTGTSTLACEGEPVILTVTGADTYTWSTGENTATLSVSPSVTTSYSVTGSSTASGCVNMASYTQSVSICTSLSKTDKNFFSVYPNPGNGYFTIQAENESHFSGIEVTDVMGRTVYSSYNENTGKPISINLSSQPKGIYFLRISLEDKWWIKKLIIE